MAVRVISSVNPLVENITFQKTPVSNKFYSSRLLNYVEPVNIGGYDKTVFYTEFNTNLNVGDRVFIVNGNYDSGDFIEKDKYTKYTDGYRILGCDGCRVVLDLDYTGTLPYSSNEENESIKVYNIQTQREFDYINSLTVNHFPVSFRDDLNVLRTYFGNSGRFSKFCGRRDVVGITASQFSAVLCTDSIIYVGTGFVGSTSNFNRNGGITTAGFYVRDDSVTTPSWINVTNEVLQNRIRIVNNQYSNVKNNLFIKGEDFIGGSIEFKQRNTYKFTESRWKLDPKSKIPYLSRLNFRYGTFKGTHKDGIFGTNQVKNVWTSGSWTSGAFINSIWDKGIMSSKSNAGEKNYYATYNDKTIPPVQTIDFSNNNGYGYNFIEDSSFLSGEIKNGNFDNCNLGAGSTFSALDIYFGLTHSFGLKLSGVYRRCDISNIFSQNAKFSNSIVNNSLLSTSKLVNSQIYYSTADRCVYTDDEGVNVIAADIWSINPNNSTAESTIRGILKLYISDDDAKKFSLGDAFYLTRLNKNLFLSNLTNDQKIKLPIETKFLFDIYSDFELENTKIIVSLKNKNDNKISSYVKVSTSLPPLVYSNQFERNTVDYFSIDIESRIFGWYERTIQSSGSIGSPIISPPQSLIITVAEYGLLPITPQTVNSFFSGTYIRNSDFKNGYFNNSTWVNGVNINYKHHVIPFDLSNSLEIYTVTNDILLIRLNQNRLNSSLDIYGEDLFQNDTVWLNSIDHIDGTSIKSIDGRYKVSTIINNGPFKEVYLRNVSGITFSATADYKVNESPLLNYSSIHKFRINNSQINSGLLCRTSIKNSTINNPELLINDRNLDIRNIEKLRLINIPFKDTKNTVKSGYVFKSHFINDAWLGGVFFNSIWNGGTFNDGVFNSAYWQKGLFKSGAFINSRDITASTQDYDISNILFRNWLDGTFENGEFFNSSWIKGTFNNGRFYNSEWFSGIWNNGILGSDTIRTVDTKFGVSAPRPQSTTYSTWNDGIVENALVGGFGVVYWYGGKFNNGEFTSEAATSLRQSIWYNGDFNNGIFSKLARWKNGRFYKGKFHSYFGLTSASPTNPSTYSTSYAWENGKFFGGEFGNRSLNNNSTWYDGEFLGGIFQGKFWYKGLFNKGEFVGSGDADLIYSSNTSNSGEYQFVNSFKTNYYGLWYDGQVSDNPKLVRTEQRVSSELVRTVEQISLENTVTFKNALWNNGTFSHKTATFQNSVWLKGHFFEGNFDSSIFNSYVDRSFNSNINLSSFAATSSCVWHGGKFKSTFGTASFYISDWETGTFENGYMAGAVWKNGVWNYGFADNVVWVSGLWRNGNWNSAPFGLSEVDNITTPFKIKNGRAKDIMLTVSSNLSVNKIYLNNVFSASTANTILTDPLISSVNTSNSSVCFDPNEQYLYVTPTRPGTLPSNSLPVNSQFLDCSDWVWGSNISTANGNVVNSHVYTTGGSSPLPRVDAESARLFACKNNQDKDVFTIVDKTYSIRLELTVEGADTVDVYIKVGNKDILKQSLLSDQVRTNNVTTYYPKQYTFNFIYSTPTVNSPDDTQFYIKKGLGGKVRVIYLSIVERDFEYHPTYNNDLYSTSVVGGQIYLPSDSEVVYQASSTDGSVVSVNIGNGIFKSGIWENGIWNNGFRSNSFIDEVDYYLFSDIVGLNGVRPYSGKGTYQLDAVTWLVTLQSIQTLQGLNVGDKISIGNVVAIDINESRKLIKDYFTIRQIDLTNSTIVVELVTNFPTIRFERDSANHLIYVTKNIWKSGAFLNGYFKGIWNNGLFKSYPKIGIIEDAQWIDGKFDGGRFTSNQDRTVGGVNYNTGLIQNFIFSDNNQTLVNEGPKFASWMDLNFSDSQKTTINEESANHYERAYPFGSPQGSGTFTYSYFLENKVELADPPGGFNSYYLSGFVTSDVLESNSIFRDSGYRNNQYRLGTKYTIYQNFIPNDGNFSQPFSNARFGLDLTNFTNDGWDYIDFGNRLTFTVSLLPNPVTPTYRREFAKGSALIIESNVDNDTKNRLRIKTTNLFESGVDYLSTTTERKLKKYVSFKLNNLNVETVKNRYYVTSLDLYTYSLVAGAWSVPVSPSITLTSSVSMTTNGATDLFDPVNEVNTSSMIKRQFFYNKQDLDFYFEVSTSYRNQGVFPTPPMPLLGPGSFTSTIGSPPQNFVDIIFNNISFWEVDMIPFFKYYKSESNIDLRIKTPWFAVAPFIDYTDSNFDFLGNVNLTIDSDTINNQANFSVFSSQGINGSLFPPVSIGVNNSGSSTL